MPIPGLAFIPAALQAGSSIAGYISARKNQRPDFEDTPFGKRLQQVSREGEISRLARSNIVGQASRSSSAVAQRTVSDTRGYLEARGFGNSISGVRALQAPKLQNQRSVFEAGKTIETSNELSKSKAKTDFARERTNQSQLQRQEKHQSFINLVNGLAGAAGSAVNAKLAIDQAAADKLAALGDKAFDTLKLRIMAALQAGDTELAQRLMQEAIADQEK